MSLQEWMIGLLEINKGTDFQSSSQFKLVTFLGRKTSFLGNAGLLRQRPCLFCSPICSPHWAQCKIYRRLLVNTWWMNVSFTVSLEVLGKLWISRAFICGAWGAVSTVTVDNTAAGLDLNRDSADRQRWREQLGDYVFPCITENTGVILSQYS